VHATKGEENSCTNFNVTACEMEILHWLVQGKSNWEIGAITGRSQAMVKRHVSNLLAKLDVGTRVQLAAKAIELGLIDDPQIKLPPSQALT
jgi:LuxR family transcriptional regulator, quorum-sensing system regulator CviR